MMAANWQRCPHCKVISTLHVGDALRARCPNCRQPLPPTQPVSPAQPAPPLPPRLSQPAPYELLFAFLVVAALTALYAGAALAAIPAPGSFIGHALGIVGFLMMLSTETLYSMRKRMHRFRLGRMSVWLQVHVFTGIVGPYLVVLHSAGKFHGLAGVLTLLTVVMVISGFVGRYLYTAVPRTLDGVELAARELEEQIARADRALQALGTQLPTAVLQAAAVLPERGWLLVLARAALRWRHTWRIRQALRGLPSEERAKVAPLERLLTQRYRLQAQMQSLAVARRLLALWHLAHVPLGVVVFTLAVIHIGGALYYATFLR
jgi:hypothetical protein